MKLFVNLFMPKMIGQFFAEKVIRPIIYLLMFLCLCAVPVAIELAENENIVYTDDISLVRNIKNDALSTIEIAANQLNTTDQKVYSGEKYVIMFNTSKDIPQNDMTLAFFEDYVNVYIAGELYKTKKYEKYKDSSLSIAKIQAGDFKEIHKLYGFLDDAYDDYCHSTYPMTLIYNVGNIFVSFVIVLLFLIISSRLFNAFIPFRIRFTIAVYASTWAYLTYFIGLVMGMNFLFYIGAIISMVFNSIAVKQIVKVDKGSMEG